MKMPPQIAERRAVGTKRALNAQRQNRRIADVAGEQKAPIKQHAFDHQPQPVGTNK